MKLVREEDDKKIKCGDIVFFFFKCGEIDDNEVGMWQSGVRVKRVPSIHASNPFHLIF